MRWILGSFKSEMAWLYLPGIAGLAMAQVIGSNSDSMEYLIFAFVAKGLFDSGHIYTTLWRTLFHKEERQRIWVYYWLPPLLFVLFYFWVKLGWPYLAALIVYATLVHNIRQFYGISRWYQRLNGKISKVSDYFLYSNCLLPFVVFHFMDVPGRDYFYLGDPGMPLSASYQWESFFKMIYLLNIVAWGIFELWRLRLKFELNRFLSVALPTLLYGVSFLFPIHEAAALFPLVVAHGAAYFALNAFALHKTQARFATFGFALFVVIVTGITFGTFDFWVGEKFSDLDDKSRAGLVAFFLVPTFCHYIFDMWIWKKSHPEGKLIY